MPLPARSPGNDVLFGTVAPTAALGLGRAFFGLFWMCCNIQKFCQLVCIQQFHDG